MTIKGAAIKSINDKYKELTHVSPIPLHTTVTEILHGLTGGTTTFNILKESLPVTGSFISEKLNIDVTKPISNLSLPELSQYEIKIGEFFSKDTEDYLAKLEKNNIKFNLSQNK